MSGFPLVRPRRLRGSEAVRALVRETDLSAADLIQPLFVCPGKKVRDEIASMPGQYNLSVDELVAEAAATHDAGVPAVMLFGVPAAKDARGASAHDPKGLVQEAAAALKQKVSGLVVIADLCLCAYTDHGHCGVVDGHEIVNDATLEVLAQTAVSQARAGADVVAPSDMMDGRVGVIRKALDAAGFQGTLILSYAVKYASAFYGPFRDAAKSAPKFGDRRTHQMDPANAREALREAALDVEEGADIVMVKPALPYLDVLYRVRQAVQVPVAAYHVSGEYAMLAAAAQKKWIDRDRVVLESLLAIRRAGADMIVTYCAREAAQLLRR